VDVRAWVTRVAALEKRLAVSVEEGPAIVVPGDGDQLDQLLINLVRNAADAALETGGEVRVRWRAASARVEIAVEDEGPGLPESGNLFVPFFTTKPQGSGSGLLSNRRRTAQVCPEPCAEDSAICRTATSSSPPSTSRRAMRTSIAWRRPSASWNRSLARSSDGTSGASPAAARTPSRTSRPCRSGFNL
jgi:hypothetical protein